MTEIFLLKMSLIASSIACFVLGGLLVKKVFLPLCNRHIDNEVRRLSLRSYLRCLMGVAGLFAVGFGLLNILVHF